MQFACPHCSRVLDFSGERPTFCGYCGRALESASSTGLEETIDSGRRFRADGRLPERVGGYEITREIGRGGMGVVFEASQSGSGRRVALKLLSPKVEPTPETIERFVREGRLAASLSHPRSTFVFDAGVEEGLPYIAMELMPGRTLRELVEQEGAQPVGKSVDYLLDAIEGLEAAHRVGVVHRDIKPSNCFLDGDGRVKIGDFGLSKSLVDDSALTRTGAFMGTPQFAAPEQIRGGAVDERTDVYALGATLFYLIAGRAPFIGDPASVIAQIVGDPAPRLRSFAPDVPPDLEQIISRMLDREPARRFGTLAALRQALLPYASGGTSIADLGRRLAAYMIDNFLAQVVNVVMMAVFGVVIGVNMKRNGSPVSFTTPADTNLPLMVIGFFPPVLYFTLAEWYWGRAIGKWLLGLRVIAAGGRRPAIWQTFVRSLFLPGSLGMPLAMAFLLRFDPFDSRDNLLKALFVGMLGTLVCNYVPTLIALSTMRRRNGFRGLHEILTRTRVVRVAEARRGPPATLVVRPLAGRAVEGLPTRCGMFDVREELAAGADYRLAVANDDTLGRTVWLEIGPAATPTPERCSLGRPARPRWLQSGTTDGANWQAFEAVSALPLRDAAEQIKRVNPPALWAWARLPLAELADELSAAVADGTLPRELTMSQVAVQPDGHLKLLDWPLGGADDPSLGAGAPGAVALLRAAATAAASGGQLPQHANRFLQELDARPDHAETLSWAAAELREQLLRPATLRWDDRLGVLGVSLGSELLVYSTVAVALPLLFWMWGLPDFWTLGLSIVVAALLPALPPLFLGESPVFKVLGVDVRRRDGRPAGRLRRAWRDLLAWLPMTVSYVCISAAVMFALSLERQEREYRAQQPPGVKTRGLDDNDPRVRRAMIGMGVTGFLWMGFTAVAMAGSATAVAHPSEGVQDFLAGTKLTPK